MLFRPRSFHLSNTLHFWEVQRSRLGTAASLLGRYTQAGCTSVHPALTTPLPGQGETRSTDKNVTVYPQQQMKKVCYKNILKKHSRDKDGRNGSSWCWQQEKQQ